MQLTVDTSWWTRYRSRANNPDLDPTFVFPQAIPSLHVGQHPAIPRSDADLVPHDHIQAIANTAGARCRQTRGFSPGCSPCMLALQVAIDLRSDSGQVSRPTRRTNSENLASARNGSNIGSTLRATMQGSRSLKACSRLLIPESFFPIPTQISERNQLGT